LNGATTSHQSRITNHNCKRQELAARHSVTDKEEIERDGGFSFRP